jgi:lactate 2-monooxygenase
VLPTMPMTFPALEVRAQATLRPDVPSYTAGSAGLEFTQRASVTALRSGGLVRRMLVGAVRRELSVDMFGLKLSTPLFMAPIGVLGLCAQDGPL